MDKTQLFNEYAEKLLNHSIIRIKDKQYRICEIEMYYKNEEHNDEYTHSHPRQLLNCEFYPHQFKNGAYKGGTYKCMDICFGDSQTNTYFGILIRPIKNNKTKDFFTGPCLCVNELLSNFDCKDFNEFFKNHTLDEIALIEHNLSHKKIYNGPRVGLSDKYPEFKLRKYRYATHIKQIKKQKSLNYVKYNFIKFKTI